MVAYIVVGVQYAWSALTSLYKPVNVFSIVVRWERKRGRSPCARQPVGSLRLLATGYRVPRLLHFLQHPVWPTLLSLDRLRLHGFFMLCLFCFCFRYYKAMALYVFIADGYTKHEGGLDLWEDYFRNLLCLTVVRSVSSLSAVNLSVDELLPAAASHWALNKWSRNGEQQGDKQSAPLH